MTIRCRTCPRPPGAYCLGVDHARICRLRDPDSPDFDPAYRVGALVGEGPGEAPSIPSAARDPVVAAQLAVAKAINRCEHRKRGPHCGCSGMMRCERDAADVAWADCVACKTAEADAHASQPDRP